MEGMELPYRQNVSGIVIREDKKILLVTKPKLGFWQFVQGGVEENEDSEKAFKRELEEETGISNFKIIGKSGNKFQFEWPKVLQDKKGFRGQQQSFLFVEIDGNPEIKLQKEELRDFKWASINGIDDLVAENFLETWKKIKRELEEILDNRN